MPCWQVEQDDGRLVLMDHDSLGPVGDGTIERCTEIVLAGFEASDLEVAGPVGVGGVGFGAVGRLYCDGGAGDGALVRINDCAGQSADGNSCIGGGGQTDRDRDE